MIWYPLGTVRGGLRSGQMIWYPDRFQTADRPPASSIECPGRLTQRPPFSGLPAEIAIRRREPYPLHSVEDLATKLSELSQAIANDWSACVHGTTPLSGCTSKVWALSTRTVCACQKETQPLLAGVSNCWVADLLSSAAFVAALKLRSLLRNRVTGCHSLGPSV
jgi:hypothetical protein